MRTLLALALSAIVLLSGCGSESGDTAASTSAPTPTPAVTSDDPAENLASARTLWAENGPADYTWTIERMCFCPSLKVRIQVVDGKVDSIKNLAGKRAGQDKTIRTMEDLFTLIDTELSESDKVRVTYDPQTGAVKKLDVDRIKGAVDDEYSYRARMAS